MIGPTMMSRLVSSLISRRAASCSDSPSSSRPPGSDHSPLRGSCARLMISARPSRTITAPTPTTGCSGYSRATHVNHRGHRGHRANYLLSDYLDQNAFVSLTVELAIEDLLPRAEV